MFQPKNKIIIITAPSGAGKTSITHFLLKKYPQLAFSVSAATRSARAHEKNGLDYYFLSQEEFNWKIQHNEFVEWEMVYEGKSYGTLKSELERIWNNNQVPVLDIDVKGAIHVQQQYPDTTLSIFVEPPSVDELKRRLSSRGTETEESLQARVNHFGKIILNDNLDHACKEAEQVVGAFLQA
jgi:guanylate kinase